MIIKDWKKEIWTIPNLLSLFRLMLIPVYVIVYLNARDNFDYYIAAGILAVSCLTDLIDGKIARHFNMISTVGKILDPLADKVTQFALIICLSMSYPVLWYLVALFVIKESFQLIAGGINLRKGRMLKGALLSGKICTTILFISLIVMVMIPQLPDNIVNIIAITDGAFMLISFGNYLFTYFSRDNKFQALEQSSNNQTGAE
jgi:cardiolipin synthase